MNSEVINKIHFIKASSSHSPFFPQCLSLVDRTQGKGIFDLNYFERHASETDKLLLLALLEDKLVGLAGARVLPSDGFDY